MLKRAWNLLALMLIAGISATSLATETVVTPIKPIKETRIDCRSAILQTNIRAPLEQVAASLDELHEQLRYLRTWSYSINTASAPAVQAHVVLITKRAKALVELIGTLQEKTEASTEDPVEMRVATREALHDLRNGLNAAHSLTAIFDDVVAEGGRAITKEHLMRLREALSAAEEGAAHSDQIAKDLLSGHPMPLRPELVNMRALFRQVQRMAQAFPANIKVTWDADLALPSVIADRTALSRALFNQVKNSVHALEAGGNIHLAARVVAVENTDTQGTLISGTLTSTQAGQHLLITVTDNGSGIPKEMIEKVFAANFTTREGGAGQGLGLSSTMSVAEEHGGYMTVSSTVGEGTTFSMFLPLRLSNDSLPLSENLPESLESGTIIVADDRRDVHFLMRKALEETAPMVFVQSGNAVVELVRANPGKVKLVFVDVMMPGLQLKDTLDELRLLDPRLRIVVLTAMGSATSFAGVEAVVPKPVDIGMMKEKYGN